MNLSQYSLTQVANLQLGQGGGTIVQGTGPYTGLNCWAFYTLSAITISSFTPTSPWSGTLASASIASNSFVTVGFSAIQLASGSLIAYNG